MRLRVSAVYGGETEKFFRFKLDGEGVNFRLYLARKGKIPERLLIDLSEARKQMEGFQ